MKLEVVITVKMLLDFMYLFEQVLKQNNDELIKQLNFLLIYRIGMSKKNKKI
jgi:uncharacterized membrane protein YjfL (UPF0719 family)